MLDHTGILEALIGAEIQDLSYGFVALSTGELVAQAGDKKSLPTQGLVEMALSPDRIVARYEECEYCAKMDPRTQLRGYAQGRISEIIGIPVRGVLLVLFGLMPEGVASADPNAQVAWYWSHRRRVWSAVDAAYAIQERAVRERSEHQPA